MGLGDETIVNPESVSATLRCCICTEVFVKPVFSSGTPCQHIFCNDCIIPALRRDARCPMCRAQMQMTHLQPHLVIQSFLDELHVRCGEAGCSWTGRQDSHNAHLDNCPSRLLAATREQFDQTSVQLTMRLAESDRENANLRAEIKDQASMYNQLWIEMSKLKEDVVQKDARIIELETELEVARSCREVDTAALLAELQAEAAAAAFEKAKATAEKAKKSAEAMRERARGANKLQLFVKDIKGKSRILKVGVDLSVKQVKEEIQRVTQVPIESFYLTYGGRYLEDFKRFISYGISRDSTLCMSFRLRSVQAVGACEDNIAVKRSAPAGSGKERSAALRARVAASEAGC